MREETRSASWAAAPRTVYEVDVEEALVSGSLAVVRGAWTFATRTPGGKTSVQKVRRFEVWRLQPDGTATISRWISAPEPSS